MKLSEKMAVRLHYMMWSDMQRELGDRPSGNDRLKFKKEWIKRNFPGESIASDCWLCEYASSVSNRGGGDPYCKHCPISWPNNHCNTLDFSYAKEPISDILALPARNEKIVAKDDAVETVKTYYQYREGLLSKASGIPASLAIEDHVKAIQVKAVKDFLKECEGKPGAYLYNRLKKKLAYFSGIEAICPIEDHVKAIQEKAVQQSDFSVMYCDAKKELANASGRPEADAVIDHIEAIQEKAVEDYFKKTPGAKLATMDVDQAFKQYADEQKAPIFHALAEASGLSAGNKSVKAHISEISSKAKSKGRAEMATEIFESLSAFSGVSKDNWSVGSHVVAIREKASNEKDMEILRKTSMQLADKLDRYKDALSKESDLDRNRPVDDHIHEIVKNSMEAGAAEERDRIQEKVYEVLLS